jgi:RNA polymerase sigma-70 factor (ECF subfamily)
VANDRDQRAFAAVFRHYAPRVHKDLVARGFERGLADDITQDVMLTVWRKAALFDPARGTVRAWISGIARSRAIERVRRERRATATTDRLRLVDAAATPAEPCADRCDVLGALDALPVDQLRVVLASHFGGLSLAAIAAREGLPLGTIKSRARLAHARLREVILGRRR